MSRTDGTNTEQDGQVEQGSSLYAALARTTTRTVALYFSRPVRLFRPSKVTGWMFLQGLASRDGVSLSPQFISNLVKQHGISVLPRHFLPPLAINALLGIVLWETYSETSTFLDKRLSHPLAVSALSGAVAGGAQAIIAAPAENVRFVLEGKSAHSGWSSAWRDVFLGAQVDQSLSKEENLRDARQVRLWVKEVGDMAGNGWKGWKWGLAKDVCGFSVFFSLFELTRKTSIYLRDSSVKLMSELEGESAAKSHVHVPRIVHGAALVSGGVLAGLSYELVGRPWDVARRTIELHTAPQPGQSRLQTTLRTLETKVQQDGLLSFFRGTPSSTSTSTDGVTSGARRRLYATLRVLGRVGPWGVGFLIWEALGPGLSP